MVSEEVQKIFDVLHQRAGPAEEEVQLQKLFDLVEQCHDPAELEKMFVGDQVNVYVPLAHYRGPLLHIALDDKRDIVVRRLLGHPKINVHRFDVHGQFPLYMSHDFPRGVELLLDHKFIDPNMVTGPGWSALHRCEGRCLELILDHPLTNVNIGEGYRDGTPLHFSILPPSDQHLKFNKLLAHPDINVNALNAQGQTPLMRFAWKAEVNLFKRLLEDDRVVLSIPRSCFARSRKSVADLIDSNDFANYTNPDDQPKMKGLLVLSERKRVNVFNQIMDGIEIASSIPEDVLRNNLLPFLKDQPIFEGRFLSNKQREEWQQYLNLA